MKSSLLELQQAIYERLKNGTSYDIYDDFPQNAEFPYITLGEVRAYEWKDKSQDGLKVIFTLHVFSQYPGKKEILEIIDKILLLINGRKLELSQNFKIFFQKLDLSEVIIDIDGITRHAILNFIFFIKEF